MTDDETLRALLRRYSLRRLFDLTGITPITLRRIRDGQSSATFAMRDAIMAAVFDDAVRALPKRGPKPKVRA